MFNLTLNLGRTVFLLAAMSLPAWGTLTFNGTPGTGGGGLVIETFVGAESFTLSGTETIEGVEFAAEIFAPPGELDWYIFGNSAPFPGAELASGANPALTVTPFSQFISIIDFNLNTPVTLNAGTYWVGLNMPSQFVVWGETTTPNAQLSAGEPISGSWNLDAVQLYLGISDQPLVTPEPGSMLLMGMGSVGLALASKLRQNLGTDRISSTRNSSSSGVRVNVTLTLTRARGEK